MKIEGNLDVFKAYKATKVDKKDTDELKSSGQTKSDTVKDKVTLSTESKVDAKQFEIDFIKKRVGDASEVRSDRVAELKEKINNGTYNVSLEDVADSIINRLA